MPRRRRYSRLRASNTEERRKMMMVRAGRFCLKGLRLIAILLGVLVTGTAQAEPLSGTGIVTVTTVGGHGGNGRDCRHEVAT